MPQSLKRLQFMLEFNKTSVRVLHLESTSVCQASCPQCARENSKLFNKQVEHLTIEAIQQHFSIEQIQKLDKMFMCGNFGDPAAGANTLEIYHWFRELNPDIILGMNTNGGLQNPSWWSNLADIFRLPEDYVIFSIDGLEDTNHIYRRGVDWQRVMDNVRSFILSGGNAQWDYLIFDHNKHQIESAKQLANQMGFTWFRTKVSKRGKPQTEYTSIRCHALKENSMYISATGELLPCCFLGNNIFTRDSDIDNALQTDQFSGVVDLWQTKPLQPCIRVCGLQERSTPFDSQWTTETEFKKC